MIGHHLPSALYLPDMTFSQAFPVHLCILQAIKNWSLRRPGNEARLIICMCALVSFPDHTVVPAGKMCLVNPLLMCTRKPLFFPSLLLDIFEDYINPLCADNLLTTQMLIRECYLVYTKIFCLLKEQ